MHTFTMTEHQARNIHQLASSHISAIKNWTLTRVEAGDLAGAQDLARQAREFQEIFAAFNMNAKHEIAAATGKELETAHTVRPRSF